MTQHFDPLSLTDHNLVGYTILQIVPDLQSGGAERACVDIAAALSSAGARSLVASAGGRMVSELQAKGGIWTPFPAATKNPLKMALNISRLARLLREEGVDLVHVRSRAPAWVAYYAAQRAGVRFVTTYHSSYGAASPIKQRYNAIMARGDVVIANSEYTSKRIREHYPAASDRIAVIPRGIDLNKFTPTHVDSARVERLRQQWGVAAYERVLLMPARLSARKGHETLIEALKILLTNDAAKDLKVILAGDAHSRAFRKNLEAQIARAGLGAVMQCVGYCDDMPAAYLAAACVVAPAIVPEAFGRVGVEAQAMGAPVIISDIGAAPEIVRAPPDVPAHRTTGWRVPPANPEALAQAITTVLSMKASARDLLSRQARDHAQARFSVEKMQRATLEVYARLLAL